jgi:hypothetical protein
VHLLRRQRAQRQVVLPVPVELKRVRVLGRLGQQHERALEGYAPHEGGEVGVRVPLQRAAAEEDVAQDPRPPAQGHLRLDEEAPRVQERVLLLHAGRGGALYRKTISKTAAMGE